MDWLLDLGYWGVLLGTFLAGTILTFSSEIILAAVLLAGGDPWICLVVATIGNGTGALTSYLLGWLGRWEWLEKWFHVKPETLEKQKVRVDKYGVWGAFFSWIPIVGQVFVIALGFTRKTKELNIAHLFGLFVSFPDLDITLHSLRRDLLRVSKIGLSLLILFNSLRNCLKI